ncbi:hypothetical protein D3C85_1315210 [compost metagenome]
MRHSAIVPIVPKIASICSKALQSHSVNLVSQFPEQTHRKVRIYPQHEFELNARQLALLSETAKQPPMARLDRDCR